MTARKRTNGNGNGDGEPQAPAEPKSLTEDEAIALEAEYRAGVDISLHELADRFEADGYDWREALAHCGYSDEEVAEQVRAE